MMEEPVTPTPSPQVLLGPPRLRVLRVLRRAARTLRHLPDRILHPLRRWIAAARLRGRGPRSILFVCHGNICRSPYAAAAFHEALSSGLRTRMVIASAGFVGAGRPAPAEAIAAASRFGVDLRAHRSTTLTPAGVRAAQVIVVMDTDQHREIVQRFGRSPEDVVLLGDLDPGPIDTRTIRDPVEQSIDVFVSTYGRIDRCVSQLIKAIAGRSSRPSGAR